MPRGELCVGNRRGLSLSGLLVQLRGLKDDMAKMEHDMAKMGEEVALIGARFDKLDNQLLALGYLSTGCRQARTQFIDTFKRDKLDTSDDGSDGEIIREGYMGAEEGNANAIADATLYVFKERSDVHIFEELYGLEPLQVLRISKC